MYCLSIKLHEIPVPPISAPAPTPILSVLVRLPLWIAFRVLRRMQKLVGCDRWRKYGGIPRRVRSVEESRRTPCTLASNGDLFCLIRHSTGSCIRTGCKTMNLPPLLLQFSHFSTLCCWLSPVDVVRPTSDSERTVVLICLTDRWMCSREDPRFAREDVLLVCTVQRPDIGFVAEKLLNMKLGNINHNRQWSLT